MTAELVRLRGLAALRLDLKLNALRQQVQAVEALRCEMQTLADSVMTARSQEPMRAEAYARWVAERSHALNIELARGLVRLEEMQAEATRAFGQKDALSRLHPPGPGGKSG